MTIAAKKELLKDFTSGTNPEFENIYNKIWHPEKETFRLFLVYVHNVLTEYSSYQPIEGIKFVHLHMPFSDESLKEVILEYATIYFFYQGLENDSLEDTYTINQIETFERKLNNLQIPEKASGAKGNREFKRWEAGRKQIRNVLNFLKDAALIGKGLSPNTIINLYHNDEILLNERCQGEWFSATIEDLLLRQKRSYVLLNSHLSHDEIVKALDEAEFLKSIRSIVLFDCEGRNLFRGFTKRYLDELRDYDIPIECLILFSFEKKNFRLRNTTNKHLQIYSNFYFQSKNIDFQQSYLFPREEKDLLCDKHSTIKSSLEWIGERSDIFKDFLDIVKEVGIDKLRSIPILNIYSLCFSQKIAEMILNGIFETANDFDILDPETKALVLDLEANEKEQLKGSLSLLLSFVIKEWSKINEAIVRIGFDYPVAIVVPHQILDNMKIQRELKALLQGIDFKLYTWNDVKEVTIKERSVTILAYRDTGIPPFDIYPNIVEHRIPEDKSVHLLFLKAFFFERFNKSMHRYLDAYNKLVSNKLRYKHLNWKEIDKSIEEMDALQAVYLIDADDSDYGIGSQSESIRIDFTDSSRVSVYPAKLLIARKQGVSKYLIIRADELLYETDLSNFQIEPLEEIHEELNLFEITPAEENELKEINVQYGLTRKDQKHALWKIELRKKLDQHNGDPALLYETIKTVTGNDDKLIQYSYFRDYWLDPKSELIIPRRSRHFRQICNYLELPVAYYRLMLKQRASLRFNSRQSNAQMNSLLAHMFNEGLFENGVDWNSLDLASFIDEHNLEEKGVFHENARTELKVLVDLLKEEMKLKHVLKVELS